jgi:hypothetical protein
MSNRINPDPNPILSVGLAVGEEWYRFTFTRELSSEMLKLLGRMAANPELSFSLHDAVATGKAIRDLVWEHRPRGA